jgi:cytochrome o ubiquinol oxidase subunit 2
MWAGAMMAGLALCGAGAACAQGMLHPLGPVAAEQQVHLIRVTAITMIAVIPVLIGVPWILWRYRRGGRGNYRPDFEFHAPLEIAMWGGPLLITAVLGYWLWHSTENLDPYRKLGPEPLQVQVIGLNWKWLFLYPGQGVASIGTLAIPAGRPVTLELTTDTVMQSFLVPSLAGQIYAMPGMVTRLNLMADQPGSMTGANTQFNGTGFADQSIQVLALSPADWQQWLDTAAAAPALDRIRYGELARPGSVRQAQQSLALPDTRMRLADDNLFRQVVARYHSGAALPASAQPGTPAYQPEAAP